ncbi:MFS transporter [Novosphingobium album (ex Liu et al. 2023)]|uniref:MFS transporter n=1 Tax=Novosphingobium album (ex Liu et al. 2023) TaxID=3031130 RepID=A0ABT5WST4_9SPHN|nr:MFS transporter [Novosphingobium album (ex Liu et al. 2023)]MDE8653095.1 MFS transporter [Novosphingobium album (ex Liu et al. 2023)]
MAAPIASSAGDAPNHPLSVRMGVIAFLAHNVIVGSIFGTTGVLLKPMMERLNVSLELASIGAPMVIVGSAVLASVAGVLAARYSLKVLLLGAAIALAAGWLIMGLTASFPLYLIAYGLFLGPSMAIGGSVLPPTLITRWFNRNRGLVIGIAHMSVVIAIMPVAANWLIEHYGLQMTFFALAAFAAIILIPAALLIVEYPPNYVDQPAAEDQPKVPVGGMSVGQLVMSSRFWMLALAVAAPNTSSVLLGVHLVSMAESWGFSRGDGALLASIMSFVGIAGFVLFGWVSDRIGGVLTIALIAFDGAVLWAMFLLGLPYPGLVVLIGLIGLHGAGTVPALSKAVADCFGQASFSRAFGLAATASLPVMIVGVIGTGTAVRLHGDYVVPILAMISFLGLAVVLALLAARRTPEVLSPA